MSSRNNFIKRREEAEGAFYQDYKPTALVVEKTIQILDYYDYKKKTTTTTLTIMFLFLFEYGY